MVMGKEMIVLFSRKYALSNSINRRKLRNGLEQERGLLLCLCAFVYVCFFGDGMIIKPFVKQANLRLQLQSRYFRTFTSTVYDEP